MGGDLSSSSLGGCTRPTGRVVCLEFRRGICLTGSWGPETWPASAEKGRFRGSGHEVQMFSVKSLD